MAEEVSRPHVLLAVSGSVATVRFAKIAVELSAFAEVCVVATGAAQHFCHLSSAYDADAFAQFQELEIPVYSDRDEWEGYNTVKVDPVLHIELHKWADIVLVAPCSANTLAKIANGLADNLLTNVVRVYSADTPVILAPAMNTGMWQHPVTATHLKAVQGFGNVEIIAPTVKELACGDVGMGALADTATIVGTVEARLASPRPSPVRVTLTTSVPAPDTTPAAPAAAAAPTPMSYSSPAPAPVYQPPAYSAPYSAPAAYTPQASNAMYTSAAPIAPVVPLVAQVPSTPSTTNVSSLIDTKGLMDTLVRLQALNASAAQTETELAQAQANHEAVLKATSVLPPQMADQARMAQEFAAQQVQEAARKKQELEKQQAQAFLDVAKEQVRLTGADAESKATEATQGKVSRFSLTKEVARRRRQRARLGEANTLGPITPQMAFADSRIIQGDDATNLFTLLPLTSNYDGVSYPTTTMVFATWLDRPPTLTKFAKEFPTHMNNGPTVVLVRVGDQVFGGFAADSWKFDGLYHGVATSFLFSITKDCQLPYHGRVKGPKQDGDPEETPLDDSSLGGYGNAGSAGGFGSAPGGGFGAAPGGGFGAGGDGFGAAGDGFGGGQPGGDGGFGGGDGGFGGGDGGFGGGFGDNGGGFGEGGDGGFGGDAGGFGGGFGAPVRVPPRNDCMRSTGNSIQFGLKDLVLTGDFSSCSSELENSYGIGLKIGSNEAMTFLAGSREFKPDEVEIWAVGSAMPAGGFGMDDYGAGGDYGEPAIEGEVGGDADW